MMNHVAVCCNDLCRKAVGRALFEYLSGCKYHPGFLLEWHREHLIYLLLPPNIPERLWGLPLSSYWICRDAHLSPAQLNFLAEKVLARPNPSNPFVFRSSASGQGGWARREQEFEDVLGAYVWPKAPRVRKERRS
jgi:hypothetical protein